LLLEASQLHALLSAIQYLDFTDPARPPWDALIQELRKASEESAVLPVPANAPPIVKKAVEALDSLDPEEQAQAIKALVQIKHPSAREALAAAVQHPTQDVRIRAALELSRFKDTRALPGLIEAQRAWQLRWEFVRTIVPFGSVAVPGLVAALNDDDGELREYAAHALGELKEGLALPALEKLTQDPVASVRTAATKAIQKVSAVSLS
jgi:HEAT repeat protein